MNPDQPADVRDEPVSQPSAGAPGADTLDWLLEHRAAGYYRYCHRRGFIHSSASLLTLLGFDSRAALEAACRDWYTGPSRESLLKAALAPPFEAQTRAVWPAGTGGAVDVLESLRAVLDARGEVVYFEGVLEPVPRPQEQQDSVERWRVMKAFSVTPRVRHSFNNLITIVGGLAGILADAEENAPPQPALTAEIRAATALVVSLFDAYFSLLEKTGLPWQVIDLQACLRGIEAVAQAICPAGVAYTAKYHGTPLYVQADPALLRVLLVALVQELLAESPGTRTLECALTRSPEAPGDAAGGRLTRPQALLRFQLPALPGRAPESARAPLPSAAVMMRVAELHGGAIETGADSGGAYCLLRLPLEAAAASGPEPAARPAETGGWAGRNVLVVGAPAAPDAPLPRVLSAAGASVDACATSAAALAKIRAQQGVFDAVIAAAGIESPGLIGFAKELSQLSAATYMVALLPDGSAAAAGRTPLQLVEPVTAAGVRALGERLFGLARGAAPVVLVTDDDPRVRLCFSHALRAAGFIVLEAGDGRAALDVLQAQRVDLLVIDIVMPEQEGLATIRALCQRRQRMPIIAVSGNHQEYLHIAKLLGADATLRKPFSAADLVAAAQRLLARSYAFTG